MGQSQGDDIATLLVTVMNGCQQLPQTAQNHGVLAEPQSSVVNEVIASRRHTSKEHVTKHSAVLCYKDDRMRLRKRAK